MRTALFGLALLAALTACADRRPPAEFPGDLGEGALDVAIAQLELEPTIVAPDAVCRTPQAAPLDAGCSAPPELALDRPELRDARREYHPAQLSRPDRYQRIAHSIERALVRSQPGTPARRTLLSWLHAAHHRWRDAGAAGKSPCLAHYLGLLATELGPGSRRTLTSYLLALELERSGRIVDAHSQYRAISDEARIGVGLSGAHAALGDIEFRASFCDTSRLAVAHGHYLVAAHGPAPSRVPLAGYARLRLAQVELQMGMLGPALRQLELAELDGVYRDSSSWHGSRRDHVRTLLERTLRALVRRALVDETLDLLVAFEPPGATLCTELERMAKHASDGPVQAQLAAALRSSCGWMTAPEHACVTTAGCSAK